MSQTLCMLCLWSWCYKAARMYAPAICSLLVGWGSRTLYVYVIHTTILGRLPSQAVPKSIVTTGIFASLPPQAMPLNSTELLSSTDTGSGYSAGSILYYIMWAIFVNAVLGSEATKMLFKGALQPYWAKRLIEGVLYKSS